MLALRDSLDETKFVRPEPYPTIVNPERIHSGKLCLSFVYWLRSDTTVLANGASHVSLKSDVYPRCKPAG